MKSLLAVLVLGVLVTEGYGRVGRPWRFRFKPRGYHPRQFAFRPTYNLQYFQDPGETYLEQLLDEEESPKSELPVCSDRVCSANEDCCAGDMCTDFDGVMGKCVAPGGRKESMRCNQDEDCDAGLDCVGAPGHQKCRAEASGFKGINEDCESSSDCNAAKGLCCQLQRRIRQRARKACLYFRDPLSCIGPVDETALLMDRPDMPNEKRIFF